MVGYRTFRNKNAHVSQFIFILCMIVALSFGDTRAICETPNLLSEKDILSAEVYEVYEQVKNKLWIEEQLNTAQKIAVTNTITLPIVLAACMGWIHPYVYIWNSNTCEYEIRSAFELTGLKQIPAWTGFWVQVNRDVNILIWPFDLSLPWPPWIVPDAPPSMSYTLQPDTYNLISVPLVPSSTDIEATFGSFLGFGEYEWKWRFSKWSASSNKYIRYNGPNEFLKLIPGRGFWAYHIKPDEIKLTLAGLPVPALSTIAFKTPSNGGSPAAHMLGNPFHYNICWWNIGVQIEMDNSLQLGKIANGNIFDTMKSWYVGLEVKDNAGIYQDTYNRAGVIETGEDWQDLLSADDLVPIGNYVRIVLKNPDISEKNPLAFDYRFSNSNEYIWEVELTTTLNEVDAQFALNNIESIPSYYHVTLCDTESGNVIDVVDDTTIDLLLSKNEPKTFLLQATRLTPTSVKDATPVEIKLNNVYPNPFNPITTISFSLSHPSYVTLKIYNAIGEKVATLAEKDFSSGVHSFKWNASEFSSGIYFYRIEAGSFVETKKMIFMK